MIHTPVKSTVLVQSNWLLARLCFVGGRGLLLHQLGCAQQYWKVRGICCNVYWLVHEGIDRWEGLAESPLYVPLIKTASCFIKLRKILQTDVGCIRDTRHNQTVLSCAVFISVYISDFSDSTTVNTQLSDLCMKPSRFTAV